MAQVDCGSRSIWLDICGMHIERQRPSASSNDLQVGGTKLPPAAMKTSGTQSCVASAHGASDAREPSGTSVAVRQRASLQRSLLASVHFGKVLGSRIGGPMCGTHPPSPPPAPAAPPLPVAPEAPPTPEAPLLPTAPPTPVLPPTVELSWLPPPLPRPLAPPSWRGVVSGSEAHAFATAKAVARASEKARGLRDPASIMF